MATQRQIAANQANALRSTGPRTLDGKEASSRNALKHGLAARKFLLESESEEEYQALRQRFYQDYKPQSAFEVTLVDALTDNIWRLRRVPAFEAMMLEREKYQFKIMEPQDPVSRRQQAFRESLPSHDIYRSLATWILENDVLGKLTRYESELLRNIQRIDRMLRLPKAVHGGALKPPRGPASRP